MSRGRNSGGEFILRPCGGIIYAPARHNHNVGNLYKFSPKGERVMSRKKKHPVKKMTEKDYRNYVMSLKDEKPVEAVVPEDRRFSPK